MTLRFGPFQLDPDRRELMCDGERVPITAKVFDTLVVLVENRDRVMEKGDLLKRLWPDCMIEEATLVQTVSMLRKVISCSRGEGTRYIATIPGRGYQFVGEVKPAEPVSPSGPIAWAAEPVKKKLLLRWSVTLFILVGAFLAGWLLHLKPQAATRSFQRPEPLTSYPGREIFPTFSPEGDRVAFMWEGENRDNWDIYVKLVGQDGVQRLTEHPAHDWSPAWSPDGKQIAFVRRDVGAGTSQLMVMSSIGGPERSILQSPLIKSISVWNQLGRLVTWHPDSEHLIVTHAEKAGQPFFLYAVSTKTGQKRKLTHSDMKIDGDMDPAVSPDGRRLAFRRKIEGWNSSVYVVDLLPSLETSGEPVMVGRRMFSPAWTRDSREIVMVDSPTRPGLWRVSGTQGNPRRVHEPIEAAFPAISLAGNRNAFSVIQVKVDIWQARLKGDPEAKPLIASTYLDVVPKFSPDGRKIAFASSRSGNPEIWVCDRDGSNAGQLTNHASADADCPVWSPDGSRIAYHANQDNYRDVFVIDAAGGSPQRLTHREGLDVAPSWSKDGQWIYFTSDRSGERCIWKIPSRGGEAVQVAKGTYAQESVDRETLFIDDAQALWSMPTAGGPKTRLLDRSWANANFEVRKEGIYLLGSRSLRFYDFKSRAVSEVFATPGPTSWGLSIAPDGKSVLFTQTAPEEADIMIVSEFR